MINTRKPRKKFKSHKQLLHIILSVYGVSKEFHLLASSVLVLADAGLGSPRPTTLRATTLNSYSTQAFRPTTVAVSMFPLTTSGTAMCKLDP